MSLFAFEGLVKESNISPNSVAVISGSTEEPELGLVPGNYDCDFLSYDDNPGLYDLNLDWSENSWFHLRGKFDLVLCEQVLEHVKNPAQALKNLALLLRPNGYLHVSVPAINNVHGAPHYYYAGFPPETLSYFATEAGLVVVNASSWSSDKGARMYSTCDWSPMASSGPLRFFALALFNYARGKMTTRNFLRVVVMRVMCAVRYPGQALLRRTESRNSVISWLVAKRV